MLSDSVASKLDRREEKAEEFRMIEFSFRTVVNKFSISLEDSLSEVLISTLRMDVKAEYCIDPGCC